MKITCGQIRAALIAENIALGQSQAEAEVSAEATMHLSLEMLMNGWGAKVGSFEYGLADAAIQRIRVSMAENAGAKQGAA